MHFLIWNRNLMQLLQLTKNTSFILNHKCCWIVNVFDWTLSGQLIVSWTIRKLLYLERFQGSRNFVAEGKDGVLHKQNEDVSKNLHSSDYSLRKVVVRRTEFFIDDILVNSHHANLQIDRFSRQHQNVCVDFNKFSKFRRLGISQKLACCRRDHTQFSGFWIEYFQQNLMRKTNIFGNPCTSWVSAFRKSKNSFACQVLWHKV